MTLNSKHNKWLQFLAEEDFPPKLLWSENTDLKFSVNNEGKKTSTRNRGTSLTTAKEKPTTKDREQARGTHETAISEAQRLEILAMEYLTLKERRPELQREQRRRKPVSS